MGADLFDWLKYPYTGGSDVAGTVVEVGPGVTKFKVGDRVLALTVTFEARNGGFQEYVVSRACLTVPLPSDVSFEEGCVVPLGLATASTALYSKDFLALDHPSVNDTKPNGKAVLISAGASSVGCNAIQLAVASGYEVITTASPKNFDLCKKLGASAVYDYRSPTLLQDLLDAFKGKRCAGGFAVSRGTDKIVAEVISKCDGVKFMSCAMRPSADLPENVQAKMVWAGSDNEVNSIVFEHFLPAALAQRKFQCAPKPLVVGHGLQHLQAALDKGKRGEVSAQKLVITL